MSAERRLRELAALTLTNTTLVIAQRDIIDILATLDAARSTSEGLDVERLARAEWEIFGGARATGSTWDEQDQAYRDRMVAHYRAVAREYAALRSEDEG